MDEREKRARERDRENRAEFAIRREEQEMARVERQMEREMEDLRDAEERAERQIEEEWRAEHFGHEPEHPPKWRKAKD